MLERHESLYSVSKRSSSEVDFRENVHLRAAVLVAHLPAMRADMRAVFATPAITAASMPPSAAVGVCCEQQWHAKAETIELLR